MQKKKKAVLCTFLGLWMVLGIAMMASAQENDTKDENVDEFLLEEIVATGTLFKNVAPVGTNTVAIDREDITTTGVSSSNDLLSEVPQITNAFNMVQTPGSDPGLPINRPNIRNLGASGASTTLVLMNGQRMVGSGILQTTPDPSVIPPGVIERMEVVPDGGSSIYGSDAIGGVINFHTRKRFEGFELTTRYGSGDSYNSWDINGTTGWNWGSGSGLVSLYWTDQDGLLGGDRDYVHADNTAQGGSDFRVTNCSPGTITENGITYALPSLTPGTVNVCDDMDHVSIVPAQERSTIYAALQQDFSEKVMLDLTAYYSERKVDIFGRNRVDDANSGVRGSGAIDSTNPYFTPVVAGQTSQTVDFSYAPVRSAQHNTGDFDVFRIVGEMNFQLPRDWQLKTSVNFGDGSNESIEYGVNAAAQAAALAGTTTATALNPYDVAATDPNVLSGILDSVTNLGRADQGLQQYRAVADGSVPLFGKDGIRLAVGAEYFTQKTDVTWGSGPVNDLTLNSSLQKRNVTSVFGEILFPLVSDGSGFGGLDLSASARNDEYSDVGSTFNPKIGLDYRPIDGLRVRANMGSSFQAPSLADLGGAVDSRAILIPVSPFRPADSPDGDFFRPTILIAGGSDDLKPEEADTWSLGVDYTPPSLRGLNVSVTYYNIDYTNAITVNPFFNPALLFSNPGLADTYIINPTQAEVEAMLAGYRYDGFSDIASLYSGGPTPYLIVSAQRKNLASVLTDGIDFDISYTWDTSFGSIDAGIAGNYLLSRDTTSIKGGESYDELDAETVNQLRLALNGGFTAGNLTGSLTINHNDSIVYNGVKVDSFTVANVYFGYTLERPGFMEFLGCEDLQVTLNIDNVLDEDPPFEDNFLSYGNGSTLGRVFTLGLIQKF